MVENPHIGENFIFCDVLKYKQLKEYTGESHEF